MSVSNAPCSLAAVAAMKVRAPASWPRYTIGIVHNLTYLTTPTACSKCRHAIVFLKFWAFRPCLYAYFAYHIRFATRRCGAPAWFRSSEMSHIDSLNTPSDRNVNRYDASSGVVGLANQLTSRSPRNHTLTTLAAATRFYRQLPYLGHRRSVVCIRYHTSEVLRITTIRQLQ